MNIIAMHAKINIINITSVKVVLQKKKYRALGSYERHTSYLQTCHLLSINKHIWYSNEVLIHKRSRLNLSLEISNLLLLSIFSSNKSKENITSMILIIIK